MKITRRAFTGGVVATVLLPSSLPAEKKPVLHGFFFLEEEGGDVLKYVKEDGTVLLYRLYQIDECDFIAAHSAHDAKKWLETLHCACDPIKKVERWSMGDTIKDGDPHDPLIGTLPFWQKLIKCLKSGHNVSGIYNLVPGMTDPNVLPVYLGCDGHYC